jgi:hypothetical protein
MGAGPSTTATSSTPWLKGQQAINLHDPRVEHVRKYLEDPRRWPDGLDWPKWQVPHELWYTGHESYWDPLAKAKQAEMDAKAAGETAKPKVAETPPETVTKNLSTPVTENPPTVTENAPRRYGYSPSKATRYGNSSRPRT